MTVGTVVLAHHSFTLLRGDAKLYYTYMMDITHSKGPQVYTKYIYGPYGTPKQQTCIKSTNLLILKLTNLGLDGLSDGRF